MAAIREMIRVNPVRGNPGRPLPAVFVTGKGWYRWNWAYRVYNSNADYSQLQERELELIDFSRLYKEEESK